MNRINVFITLKGPELNRRFNSAPSHHLNSKYRDHPRRGRLHQIQRIFTRFYVTGHGFACQISWAYSAMVRSLENFPDAATFKTALRTQASGSA